MSELMSSGTGAGLVAFLEWTADRGVLPLATANSYRVATTKVLEIEPDPYAVDVRNLDVEDLLDRFARLRGGNYTPDSLATYKTRFRKAMENYLRYLHDPGNFRPVTRSAVTASNKRPRATIKRKSAVTAADVIESELGDSVRVSTAPPSAEEIFQYPFRLRSGQTAYLHLPPELHRSDVDRLVRLLESLVPASDADQEPAVS